MVGKAQVGLYVFRRTTFLDDDNERQTPEKKGTPVSPFERNTDPIPGVFIGNWLLTTLQLPIFVGLKKLTV